MKDQSDRLEERRRQATAGRSQGLNELQERWESSLAELSSVVKTIDSATAGLATALTLGPRDEQATRNVAQLFNNSKLQFEASSLKTLRTFKDLSGFVEELWSEKQAMQEQLDKIRAGRGRGIFGKRLSEAARIDHSQHPADGTQTRLSTQMTRKRDATNCLESALAHYFQAVFDLRLPAQSCLMMAMGAYAALWLARAVVSSLVAPLGMPARVAGMGLDSPTGGRIAVPGQRWVPRSLGCRRSHLAASNLLHVVRDSSQGSAGCCWLRLWRPHGGRPLLYGRRRSLHSWATPGMATE